MRNVAPPRSRPHLARKSGSGLLRKYFISLTLGFQLLDAADTARGCEFSTGHPRQNFFSGAG